MQAGARLWRPARDGEVGAAGGALPAASPADEREVVRAGLERKDRARVDRVMRKAG